MREFAGQFGRWDGQDRALGVGQAVPAYPGEDRPGQGATAARVSVDQEVNSEWDLLIRLATQAWSWRDPESLDVLEHTVSRLRTWIGSEWSV